MLLHHPHGFQLWFSSIGGEKYEVSVVFNAFDNEKIPFEFRTYKIRQILVRFQKPNSLKLQTNYFPIQSYTLFDPKRDFEEIVSNDYDEGEILYESMIDLLADIQKYIEKFSLTDYERVTNGLQEHLG